MYNQDFVKPTNQTKMIKPKLDTLDLMSYNSKITTTKKRAHDPAEATMMPPPLCPVRSMHTRLVSKFFLCSLHVPPQVDREAGAGAGFPASRESMTQTT